MKFVDQVRLQVNAGDGGNGCVAFRREKYIPFGGPAGGDGGHGGSVVFVADEGRTSLLDLAHGGILRAQRGEHGRGKDQYGKRGEDLIVRVPIGTQVYDFESGALLADLGAHGERAVIAKGGQGGRGNIHFASSFDRAPRRAEPGGVGDEKRLRLELKVMADVGLLGFPNVGKSTLVRAMSRARPKVADYPFTTLQPHLGVVKIGGRASSATFVLADIPGLVPGASEGRGIGTRFLKHVERCRALLHLIAPPTDALREEGRAPLADYDALLHELAEFAPELAARPMIVAMSKGDLPETQEAYELVKKDFAKRKIPLRLISAATGQGLPGLANDLYRLVRGRAPEEDDAEAIGAVFPSFAGAELDRPKPSTIALRGSAKARPSKKKRVAKKPAAKNVAPKAPASKRAAAKKKPAQAMPKRRVVAPSRAKKAHPAKPRSPRAAGPARLKK